IWLALPGEIVGYTALGLTGAALIVSVVWSLLIRDRFMTAAVKLDVAAGLRERLSTGLYCEKLNDPFAHAVVADAHKAVATIRVSQHLPVEVPRSASWAGGSMLAALLFFWLF